MSKSSAQLTITLMGTGTSTGVPIIGCTCEVCSSEDPRDTRLRTSALVEVRQDAGSLNILLDTGPDFRQQALKHNLRRVDAVLYTHAHFDHIAGLDDLRPFFYQNKRPIPCFAKSSTAQTLRQTHAYVFTDRSYAGAPLLELREIAQPFVIESRYELPLSIEVLPLEVFHGDLPIHGYRIGSFAYLTDVSHIPESIYGQLEGLDVLILDALRPRPHNTHFSIDEAVQTARRIGAQETYFTHLTHDVLHQRAESTLPAGIYLGYDGCTISCHAGAPQSVSSTESPR